MSKFDEMLKEVQELNLKQEGCWDDDLYGTALWEKYFEGKYAEVESGLDVDRRRWYETSITVLEIEGRFLGIRSVTTTFSESMGFEECGYNHYFFEMEEVKTVTYQEKGAK